MNCKEERKSILRCMCVGLPMSLYGSLMAFISWLSHVTMLKQAAKPKAACADMTLFPKDWASLSETEHGRQRAQSIRQQQCSYQSGTTGNTRKQGITHLQYRSSRPHGHQKTLLEANT